MALVVQKYGGSSVADAQQIKSVARRIAKTKEAGNQVVVVVSAMGDTTDELIELTHQITQHPDEREMDALLSTGELVSSSLMAMALMELGHKAISLSGAQAGIHTETTFSRARILKVEPKRLVKELQEGKIVVVAGFQGIAADEEIDLSSSLSLYHSGGKGAQSFALNRDVTTLGRGGSDTSAVALAVALKADRCEIYTDVDGVYTADPRVVPEARPLKEIGYEEMLELATYGAKVMHPRAVELGELFNMPILVACSFNYNPGTIIHGGLSMEVRNKVRGIAYDMDIAKITVVGVPDRPGIAATIFDSLSQANISVDTIVQNASINNITDLTFTVSRGDLAKAMQRIEPVARSLGARECVSDAKLGKVSIVGTGMQNTPGYASKMFQALYKAGINIQLITTSEIRITCIIEESKVKDAVKALHQAFELEKIET